jgi:uncharacterized protein (DUF2336 family)
MPPSFGSGSNTVDRRNGALGDKRAVAATHQSLIDELETAVGQRSIGSRVDILRRVTDLFIAGSESFNGEQRALFDDVMCRLVNEIEYSARAAFGERLATIANPPPKVTCALALDDLIEVAGPVLLRSEQLDDDTLITGAKTKSQDHLLAISRRKLLSEGVTDILVERGNKPVVISTASNPGAQFSDFGYSTLITRAEADDELALTVWLRTEIPREYLLTLFAAASKAVQLQFEVADQGKAALVRDMVRQASDQIQTRARERSPGFAVAQAQVQLLHQEGALTEDRLREFAEARSFDQTVVALSLLIDLPIGAIERTLVHDHSDQVLVLAKSIGLSWDTTKAILLMQATTQAKGRLTIELDQCLANFKKVKPETARTALQFYRLRERAVRTVAKH